MLNLVSHNRGVLCRVDISVDIRNLNKNALHLVMICGLHYFHTFKEKERVISKCFTADTFISAQVSSAARRGAELFLLFLSSHIQPPSLLCDNPSQKNPTLDILTFLHLLQKYIQVSAVAFLTTHLVYWVLYTFLPILRLFWTIQFFDNFQRNIYLLLAKIPHTS